uniref:CSON001431 protein n=1 Tax=Culicoides sonorensis TaxID=179676 RepID=A0A336MU90_CULSO
MIKMVVSRGKRKQKEIAKPIPIPDPPKRLKFQAQRKFAQGQGNPATSSSYLNFANSSAAASSQSTPIKENQNPPPELLPNQRPNTEDFLTFLCFRNTPVLPPALDFLNPNKKQQQTPRKTPQKAVNSTKTPPKAEKDDNKKMGLSSSTSSKAENSNEIPTPVKNENKKVEENGESSKGSGIAATFPGAVRKRAEKVPMTSNKFQQQKQTSDPQISKKTKNDTKVANALKKKYAKLNKNAKQVTKIDNNAATRRTRAHPGADQDQATNDSASVSDKKEKTPQKRKSSLQKHLSNNSLVEDSEQQPPVKKSPRTLIREGSIKNVKVVLNKDELESVTNKSGILKNSGKKKKGKITPNKKVTSEKEDTDKKEEEPVKDEIERRQTRFASFRIPPPLPKERKKKIDSPATVDKSATSTPSTPEPIPNSTVSETAKSSSPVVATKSKITPKENANRKVTEKEDEPVNKKVKKDIDFSSEDDEPLIKTSTGKKTPLIDSDDGTTKPGRRTLHKAQPKKSNFIDEIVKKLDDEIENYTESPTKKESPTVTSTPDKPKPGRGRPKRKSDVPAEIPVETKKVMTDRVKSPAPQQTSKKSETKLNSSIKLTSKSPTPVASSEKADDEEKTSNNVIKKKMGRGRRPGPSKKSLEAAAAAASESPHEFSEPEARTQRPSRKTKEAATIYMELIGRKLSLKELSDDDSLDSLELPNIQRMQQMEDEIKSSHEKQVELAKNASPIPVKADETPDEPVIKKKRGRKKKIVAPVENSVDADTKEDVQEEPVVQSKKEITGPKPKILEKSFSDSDEEPLATKTVKPVAKKESPGKKGRKTSTPNKKDTQNETKTSELPIEKTPSPVKLSKWQERLLANSSPKSKASQSPVAAQKLFDTSPTKDVLNKTDDSLKVNRSSAGGKAVFSPDSKSQQQQKPGTSEIVIDLVKEKPFVRPNKIQDLTVASHEEIEDDEEDGQKPLNLAPKSLLGNLLPSKEEQNKIFGIASVTLAQSSGPLDTKCTLGKCGSVHKPPLGPAVLTESNLGGHLSPKDRRKSKVNMTHEQIQRWIEGVEVTPVPDDLDDDFELGGPITKMSPYPSKDFMDESSSSQKTITKAKEDKPGQTNRVKSPLGGVNTNNNKKNQKDTSLTLNVKKEDVPTTSFTSANEKTPKSSLENLFKKEEVKKEEKEPPKLIRSTPELFSSSAKDKSSPLKSGMVSPTLPPKITSIPEVVPKIMVPSSSKIETNPVPTTSSITTTTAMSSPILSSPLNLFTSKTPLKSPLSSLKTQDTNKTPQNSQTFVSTTPTPTVNNLTSTTIATSSSDKKPVYCPVKRTPIYKQIETSAQSSASKPVVNIFGTFSPENEKSIYSFDEPDQELDGKKSKNSPGAKKGPGRGRGANAKVTQGPSNISNTDDSNSGFKNPTPPKAAAATAPAVSLTLSPEESSKIAAINFNSLEGNSNASDAANKKENNDAGGDSDSEGQTFYIPLSAANIAGGSKLGEMIQGVKLKLGTEGPEGPNQRVIMHAKLVTKAEMGDKSTPIPEGMANMTEIVKALTSSKDLIGKSVPVGTVQPRFKSSDSNADETKSKEAVPSVTVQPTEPAPGMLARINSNSSLSSARSKPLKPLIQPSNPSIFPHVSDPAQMVDAPIFRPTEKEFQDPIEFFERIMPIAAPFGLCRVIPPASFKPECRISDDMRFTAYNQYIHKMLHRWGPSARELAAIKKYLETQNIPMQHPPWIGGMEVDLPRLYHTVQELGGLKEVIEKKKWPKVSEEMCIPKTAHDRVSKLDDIYCKYLLPYDTLSPSERQKLFDEVEADWAKQEAKARRNADRFRGSDDDDSNQSTSTEDEDEEDNEGSMECIVKGRSMPLNQFFRIARNTMSLWFKNAEPTSAEVEAEFWRHVAVRDSHVCVHSGSIDSSGYGYGFPTPGPKGKGSPCAKHPWNLKVLTNNHTSILRALGPVTGVTVPTIHVGMLFSACCWYRDPHGLPWIEYMHTGGSKIWYGVPDEQSSNFRTALTNLIPTHCQNKTVWLPCDTAMVPPHMLTDKGVSLCRTEQEPGQFVLVFPRAYTSSICTGYTVSESVMFASISWLETAKADYEDMHDSCEPAMFSLEQLLFAIASDQRSTKNKNKIAEEFECEFCRANLSISMVKVKQESSDSGSNNDDEETVYCLHHALKNLQNNRLQAKYCKLAFSYTIDEIETLIAKNKDRVQQQGKGKKKNENAGNSQNSAGRKSNQGSGLYQPSSSKYSGMPTMLK